MTGDEVLTCIGAHVREEQREDSRFERIARGDESELADLERSASESPQLAMRLAASFPLGEDAIERIAARAAGGSRPNQARQPVMNDVTVAGPGGGSSVVVPGGSWTRRMLMGAGPLALAAAMVLYVGGETHLSPRGPDLPMYTVSASGEQAIRGPAVRDGTVRLALTSTSESRFEIVLRPVTAPSTKVVAFPFAMLGDGEKTVASPLEGNIEVAAEGAVRITGFSRMLHGAHEVRVVIAAPPSMSRFDDAAAHAKDGRSAGQVQVLVIPIDRTHDGRGHFH